MVRLVIDHEDVFHTHQIRHDALDHLALGLGGQDVVAGAAFEELATAFGNLDALTQLEGVVVGNDDLGAVHLVEHVARHQFAVLVVAVRIVRLEDLEAVLDGEAGGDDEESTSERLAAGAANRVDRLPGDEHGHDCRLASAGGELERKPHEIRVGLLVDAGQEGENAFPGNGLGSHFGEPDGSFHSLDLTEERAGAAEFVMPPVLEKPLALRRHLPQSGSETPPDSDKTSNLVDDGIGVVTLLLCGDALALVEEHFILILGSLPLLGLGDGSDELGAPPGFDDFLGRLPVWSQLPVSRRALVGGV